MRAFAHFAVEDRNATILGRHPIQPGFPPRSGDSRLWPGEFAEFLAPQGPMDQHTCADLTGRECTILQLLGHGLSNKETAKRLGISPETVKSHVKNIFLKLNVERRAQAVSRGVGLGVITPA